MKSPIIPRLKVVSDEDDEGMKVEQTEVFSAWLRELRDRAAMAVIARRISRLSRGNLGDLRTVGGGVSELRINYGPGYRVYFTARQGKIIILLCGGDKDTQPRDIKRAQSLASEV